MSLIAAILVLYGDLRSPAVPSCASTAAATDKAATTARVGPMMSDGRRLV